MQTLIEELPAALSVKLRETLGGNEQAIVQLKGAFKEALVCTERRVLVIKAGFMTGNTFGANVFQLPYRQVSSVEVKFGMLAGYFELSAAGVPNTAKSYWSNSGSADAKAAPNSISLNSRELADRFRAACTFITDRIGSTDPQGSPPAQASVADELAKLATLAREGYLSREEFEVQKRRLLSSQDMRLPNVEPSDEVDHAEEEDGRFRNLDLAIKETHRQNAAAGPTQIFPRRSFGKRTAF